MPAELRFKRPAHWAIAADVWASLREHAAEVRPRECCGLLIGPRSGTIISASRRADNLSTSASRFELDPQAHVRALRETRGTPFDVRGFYHSHPHSAPFPSATDLAESSYPDVVHVIVGFPTDGADAVVRAFVLRSDGYDEVMLTVA